MDDHFSLEKLKPKYHHIDKGIPPKTNAARPAGEWQTLDIIFQAPRFDSAGKKTGNARLVKVVLNGQVIHEKCSASFAFSSLRARCSQVITVPIGTPIASAISA